MACPAATWLSTGMSDEGERGHLQRQESRLRRGLIKISLHQECKQQRKRDRKGEKKKKDDPALCPLRPSPPLATLPSGPFEVLTNRPALSPVSALHSAGSRSGRAGERMGRDEPSSRRSDTARSIDCVTALFSGPCQSCQPYELISGGGGGAHIHQSDSSHAEMMFESPIYPIPRDGSGGKQKFSWFNLCLKKVRLVWVHWKSLQVNALFFLKLCLFVLYRSIFPTWLDNIFQDPAH